MSGNATAMLMAAKYMKLAGETTDPVERGKLLQLAYVPDERRWPDGAKLFAMIIFSWLTALGIWEIVRLVWGSARTYA